MSTRILSSKMLSQLVVDGSDESKFCLLLGAGASAASGIPTAGHLVDEWREQLRTLYLEKCPGIADVNIHSKEFLDFYEEWRADRSGDRIDPSDYSLLFEFFKPTTALRQAFIENAVDDKYPSFGYLYLSMLVDAGYFNVIFTTNFDNLVNDALYRFIDSRPLVCSFDSEIESIRIVSRRPKIIKLHGDYLFNNIRNTSSETRNLTRNMTDKFMQFCKEFGLIVIGYAGCDDSVMDIVKTMLKDDDYLKMGLHWCLRKGEDFPKSLHSSAGYSDRLHFYEIDSFDILMSALCESSGIELPIEVTDPTQSKTITKLTNSAKAQTTANLSEKIIADAAAIVHALQEKHVSDAIVIKELHLRGKLIQKQRSTVLPADTISSVKKLTEKCDTVLASDISRFEFVDVTLIKGVAMMSAVQVSGKEEAAILVKEVHELSTGCKGKLAALRSSGDAEQRYVYCRLNFNAACVCGLLASSEKESLVSLCKDACGYLKVLIGMNEGIDYLDKVKRGEESDLEIFNGQKEFAGQFVS